MLQYLVPLLVKFLQPDFLGLWYYPVFALAFIATVPRIIRAFLER